MPYLKIVLIAFVAICHQLGATLLPSSEPPSALASAEAHQLIMLSFDDNPEVEPMHWILDFLKDRKDAGGNPVRAVFYANGKYLDASPDLQAVHRRAVREGHEIGNHTYNHYHGGQFTVEEWVQELQINQESLVKAGIPAKAIRGFRAPFLEYNAATFTALEKLGFLYDTSIEEGYQADQLGRDDFLWPYTLDEGSPGNAWSAQSGSKEKVGSHPSLWQIPLHVLLVPDDATCERYGIEPGLRQRIYKTVKQHEGWEWNREAGKITGFDWNVLESARCTPAEYLAILKHSLDERLAGNRAPFMVGLHTQFFPANLPDRRKAIESFIDYALSKSETRFLTGIELIAWMKQPVEL